MTDNLKVLGQAAPDATTDTDLYTVPDDKHAMISSVVACNRNAGGTTVRVAVRVAGEALTSKQYLAFDAALPGNDTKTLRLGITLSGGDVITVRAASANVSFNAFGLERTT